MLTQETKRKIDSARQILVGKVPDPKAQVEQITTALIYKFMDDMDKDAMELGGKARFFTNGFEKYAWTKLLDPKLGGHEKLELYAEAIVQMSTNPHIPQLFRDIFKDAFLPYRNPETLSLFLKEINGFTYDHSEDLGDAFEYLLSIMGSQGDAGQFRTPRHIIDFIVEVIDPKKNESILDPACGTAGFLISAYKYILKQHDGIDNETGKQTNKEKHLTPDERKRMMNNFVGYDISPDMVKLSKVNMYLHDFAEPKIYEYDTLSSDEKWDEMYDVIMANPPFMSPKGGIRPHKRFSVQANRAEVLFVDYIKEHLRPNGRSGVIVPEGIIFKNDTAYKQLRKMLVEDGLFAVVSLPAGVFNPYSGVKTSILFFDNALAKLASNILFVKINNDGYGLGAQRKEIKKNDLPRAVKLFKKYIDFIKNNKTSKNQGLDFILENQDLADLFVLQPNDFHPAGAHDLSNEKAWELRNKLSEFFQAVEKDKIAKGGSYNLSGDRYKQVISNKNQKWPMVELGTVTDVFVDGNWIESKDQSPDGIRLIQTGNIGMGEYLDKDNKARYISADTFKRLNCTEVKPGDVLVSRLPDPVGRASLVPDLGTKMITAVDCTIIRFDKNKVLSEYFIAISRSNFYFEELSKYLTGSSRRRISRSNLARVKIPLPPIEVQREIVEQIEGYQKIIDGAKQIVENYKPQINYLSEWPSVKLGSVCKFAGGTQPPKSTFINHPEKGYVRLLQIRDYKSDKNAVYIPTKERHKVCLSTDVMIGRYGPPVFQILKGKKGAYNVALMKCIPDKKRLLNEWLYYFLKSDWVQKRIISLSGRVRQSGVRPNDLNELEIPLPSLDIQKKLIEETEKEEKIIIANRHLIELMEEKIKKVLENI